MLFDHFQEIRQVIGSNAVTAAQTVKTNAEVTAIDATPQANVLIAGMDTIMGRCYYGMLQKPEYKNYLSQI